MGARILGHHYTADKLICDYREVAVLRRRGESVDSFVARMLAAHRTCEPETKREA